MATDTAPQADGDTCRAETREELQARVFGYGTGALSISALAIGDKLGLYKVMAAIGPCDSVQLAKACDLHERWVREWLLQQAAAKLISCNEEASRFWLTEAQADVLANEEGEKASPYFSAGGMSALPALGGMMAPLCAAFKTGRGLPYDAYGTQVACGVCRELRVWPKFHLIESINNEPELKAKMGGACKVADLGCGEGEVLMLLAEAFPACTFVGYDTSKVALSAAQAELKRRGLTNVCFSDPSQPGGAMPDTPTFDAVVTFDALHDMARPDLAMAAVRKALKPDGAWFIGDFDVRSPSHNVHCHPMGAMLYGYSLHLCMSSAMSEEGAMGLGTCGFTMEVADRLLKEAGFSSLRKLDIPHELMAFYLAKP